jgi:tetratricopeptide (TPR) repeat protein
MTHIHPLWPDAVQPEALISGRKLLEKSEDAKNTSDRERAYLSTLQAFYDEDNASERNRLQKFLSGWTSIHEQYPEDIEARLFYALALLAVPPADNLDFAVQQKAGAIAEAVKAEIPKHPGANHYIIHAYDFPPLARRALETARHYDEVAPENSHALHMPSHIFTRRGLWPESITYNVRAAEAAIARTPDGRVSMHHMHAIDYLVYAYLQQAEDEKALEVLERMNTLESPHQNHAATAYAFAAIPARLSLEMHRWDEAARLIPRTPASFPWDQYPHLVAIPVFAKALGAARTGDFTTAEDAIEELAILKEQAAALNMIYDWGVQVEIQKVAAEAWLAFGRGDIETAITLMQMSADMESSTGKNPVTPGEVLPARELYGDMLLEIGRFQQARSAYEAVLKRTPNRFLSIFGAGHSAELSGDDRAAREYYMKLLDNSPNPTSDRVELTIARDSLASNA